MRDTKESSAHFTDLGPDADCPDANLSEFRTNCPRSMQAPLGIASAITRQTNGTILLEAFGLWCEKHRDKRIQALLKDLEAGS